MQINLRLDEAVKESIDRARGDVPRNTWILRAIENQLAECSYGPGASREFGSTVSPSKDTGVAERPAGRVSGGKPEGLSAAEWARRQVDARNAAIRKLGRS